MSQLLAIVKKQEMRLEEYKLTMENKAREVNEIQESLEYKQRQYTNEILAEKEKLSKELEREKDLRRRIEQEYR